MKMYVQSASQERDYYWVEVRSGTRSEISTPFPYPEYYKELSEYLDSETPSLLIAMVPSKQLFLLVKGVISQRRDRQKRSIENSFLLIFDQKEETLARVFAAMLLPAIQDTQQRELPSIYSKWLKQINRCITDDPSGTFHVGPDLLEVVDAIIKEGERQRQSSRQSASIVPPSKAVALAKNSLRNREELAQLLYAFPLPLRGTQRRIIPLVVVTGNEAPETLVRASAWRILTLLSEHEHWYKPRQDIPRFAVLIGVGVLCAIILVLVILLLVIHLHKQ